MQVIKSYKPRCRYLRVSQSHCGLHELSSSVEWNASWWRRRLVSDQSFWPQNSHSNSLPTSWFKSVFALVFFPSQGKHVFTGLLVGSRWRSKFCGVACPESQTVEGKFLWNWFLKLVNHCLISVLYTKSIGNHKITKHYCWTEPILFLRNEWKPPL